MPDDERDDQPTPGGDGFLADLLRQSTITGTEKDDPAEPPDSNGTTEQDEPDADEA
ncbi:hypothetical protein ACQPZQ_39350 [Pseudonocardia sp. CA-142604]|uniref:hypothetical protein n=1 Tax=Pseudonocardia sp. CA-142604 TaxID=3240024 RepID=UPI003D8F2B79